MNDLPPPEDPKLVKQDYQSLRALYLELDERRQDVRKLEGQCKSSAEKLVKRVVTLQQETSDDETLLDVKNMREKLWEMKSTLPKPSTLFLRLILGDISVTLPNRDDKVIFKQNYEKFKMFHVVLICILSIVSLILSDYVLPSALVHCVSVWYYFTVTLRELILISNGSRIKWWWLTHHYCSIAMATLLLTWPPGECYRAFKSQFMLFTFILSLVMGLQFRYQRAKLYRQVAMGEKHHMAISQEGKPSTVNILIVCLIGVYIFQLYNGITLAYIFLVKDIDCSQWQVPILSMLFLFLATMNCSTLTSVMKSKKNKSL